MIFRKVLSTLALAVACLPMSAHAQEQQVTGFIDFDSGDPERGAAVLVRNQNDLRLSLSTMDLNPGDAYTVWWVVFNRPQNCLMPFECGEPDVFSSPGSLNERQITQSRISVFYAAGFIAGDDGVGNITTQLNGGTLPNGTFVNFGWSSPVALGPDSNSGLLRNNGLAAEVHVVLRTHGPALAGFAADQLSTFDGLCDVQHCADVQAAIFRPPTPQSDCIDTDGDGWGWNGFASCRP